MNKFKNLKITFNEISPYIKPYKIGFMMAILFIVFPAIISALSPKVEGVIITKLTEDVIQMSKGIIGASVHFAYITKILIILAILYVSYTVLTYAANFLLTNAIQNTMRDLRNSLLNKIKKLPISYFDKNSYGDILSRISNDVDTISNALQQSFSQVVNSILAVTLAVAMMFTINLTMAILATLIIPISYLVWRFIVKKSQRLFKKQQNALGKLNGSVQKMYTGFNEIKLYGKQDDAIKEFKEINEELCQMDLRHNLYQDLCHL